MRFALLSAGLVATTLPGTVLGWVNCQKKTVSVVTGYAIHASDVDNVPSICGGLWDNLKRHPDCIGVSAPECYKIGDGLLRWRFNVGSSCDAGRVHSAWWEATRNRFGELHC